MRAAAEVAWLLARRTFLKSLRRPVVLTFSLVQPLIWMSLFGFLFAGYRLTGLPASVPYLDFVAPGVCAMTVLFGASQAGILWIRDLQTGFLPRLLNTPVSVHPLLLGKLVADITRLLLQAAAVLGLAMLLGARFSPSPRALAVALLALMLFAAAFASLSCAVALRARTPEAMGAFVHLVNMPLLFTSTALVPSRQMPGWLEVLARFNPLSLAVDALRGALLLDEPVSAAGLLPLGLLVLVLYGLAAREIRQLASLY